MHHTRCTVENLRNLHWERKTGSERGRIYYWNALFWALSSSLTWPFPSKKCWALWPQLCLASLSVEHWPKSCFFPCLPLPSLIFGQSHLFHLVSKRANLFASAYRRTQHASNEQHQLTAHFTTASYKWGWENIDELLDDEKRGVQISTCGSSFCITLAG